MKIKTTGMKQDFIASYMRSLSETFNTVLSNMESFERVDYDYVDESLKRAQIHIKNLRKFLNN